MSQRSIDNTIVTAGGKSQYHHGSLKSELIRASAALIEKEGNDALTLRRIASLAGVSRTAPYRHFKDKSEILQAVAEAGFQHLNEDLRLALDNSTEDPMERVVGQGIAYVLFAYRNKAQFHLMFGRELATLQHQQPAQIAGLMSFQTIIDSIDWLKSRGITHDFDSYQIAIAAWTMIHGLATLVVNGLIPVDSNPEDLISHHVRRNTRLFFEGLLPRPG